MYAIRSYYVSSGQSTERNVEREEFHALLNEHIATFKQGLKPVQLKILEDRVLAESPLSLQEIGDEFNITRRITSYNVCYTKLLRERLEREGFAPTPRLLAERFGVDEGEIIDVDMSLGAADVSMDTPLHPGNERTPASSLSSGSYNFV